MNSNSILKREFTFLERLYLRLHRWKYHHRKKNQAIFHDKFVISIGNLTTGGTGKTPLTIFLSEFFLKRGFSVLIVHRGYKGKFSGELLVSSDGKIHVSSFVSGDEAYLIAHQLLEKNYKNFKVVCGKNRKKLISDYGNDAQIVILDDAFQNPSVYRNWDVVLLDTTISPMKYKLLPLGRFREPLDELSRADVIFLTRKNEKPNDFDFWFELSKGFQKPIFFSEVRLHAIEPELQQKEVLVVCGIGNPHSFLRLIEGSFHIKKAWIYPDHHQFKEKEIQSWLKYKIPILITEKDWVRLIHHKVYQENTSYFHKVKINLKIEDFLEFEKKLEESLYGFGFLVRTMEK
ncbi:MAG: tetraacyldisaccharide 4'-kinase [Leptospiraceae bacterium]|nr:tetraacyldisaccharide 4'-kinase [Leptospiraceae bacterium]MDW7975456.1 tetraacyldisaccharide 4'-kinase [Leptospiraceae bacterium]